MIYLSDLLEPTPSPLWHLVRQAGVDGIVTFLDGGEQQDRWMASVGGSNAAQEQGTAGRRLDRTSAPWSSAGIKALVHVYAECGLRILAIEDTPPMEAIRMGLPGKEDELSHLHEQIRAMGEAGIGVLCYNWMPVSSWARTRSDVPTRGGAVTTAFRLSDAERQLLLPEAGRISADQLWSALDDFLDSTLPVAEQAGVKLALHPDDPPVPALRGLPRIVNSVQAYRRILRDHPSPSNCITFCQGNWRLMTDDLPATISEFLPHIAFVHFRDVVGDVTDFVEAFQDDGPTDMAECMRRYVRGGFDGPMRPDHVPTMYGEANDHPGYATLGRLFALGYARGLIDATAGRQ